MTWIKIMGSNDPIPEPKSFAYTGAPEAYKITKSGLYMLEVWGAQGANAQQTGVGTWTAKKGGYSKGYVYLKKGQTLYVVCGQRPATAVDSPRSGKGGYNGGGGFTSKNTNSYNYNVASGSGGATHIAFVSGTLSTIGKTEFVTNKKGLIVAGGAGGVNKVTASSSSTIYYGGAGGGTSGAAGDGGGAGTQSAGYSFGTGGTNSNGGGAGGGFYGGKVADGKSGGGGSGWIGGVPEITYKGVSYKPSTSQDNNSGNGKAKITFIEK